MALSQADLEAVLEDIATNGNSEIARFQAAKFLWEHREQLPPDDRFSQLDELRGELSQRGYQTKDN